MFGSCSASVWSRSLSCLLLFGSCISRESASTGSGSRRYVAGEVQGKAVLDAALIAAA
jgi:hypothetical protein